MPPCTEDDSCDEGDLCLSNDDCGDGMCASTGLYSSAPGQLGVCTLGDCGNDVCAEGWSCVEAQTSAGDPLFVCVPGDL